MSICIVEYNYVEIDILNLFDYMHYRNKKKMHQQNTNGPISYTL